MYRTVRYAEHLCNCQLDRTVRYSGHPHRRPLCRKIRSSEQACMSSLYREIRYSGYTCMSSLDRIPRYSGHPRKVRCTGYLRRGLLCRGIQHRCVHNGLSYRIAFCRTTVLTVAVRKLGHVTFRHLHFLSTSYLSATLYPLRPFLYSCFRSMTTVHTASFS